VVGECGRETQRADRVKSATRMAVAGLGIYAGLLEATHGCLSG
jgi:hypothetical protein